MERIVSTDSLIKFEKDLRCRGKRKLTIDKYVHDMERFSNYLNGRQVTETAVQKFRLSLFQEGYANSSINSMMISLNAFFEFTGWNCLKVKNIVIHQKQYEETDFLVEDEYKKLLRTAKAEREIGTYHIIRVIHDMNLRMKDLQCITVESLRNGFFYKPKRGLFERIEIEPQYAKSLLSYAESRKIDSGPVFITSKGKPVDRSNIWRKMKKLCRDAGLAEEKVSANLLSRKKQVIQLKKTPQVQNILQTGE